MLCPSQNAVAMEITVLSLAGNTLTTVKADPSTSVLDLKELISVQQANAHPATWMRLVLQGLPLNDSDRLCELHWGPTPTAPTLTLMVVPTFDDILFSPVAVARLAAEVLDGMGDAGAPYIAELFADERFAGSRARVLGAFRRIPEAEGLTNLKVLLVPYVFELYASYGNVGPHIKLIELFEWIGYPMAPHLIAQLASFHAAKRKTDHANQTSRVLARSKCPPCVRACAVTFFASSEKAEEGVQILRNLARELEKCAEASGGETRRGYPELLEAISSGMEKLNRKGGKHTQKRIDALKHFKAQCPWAALGLQDSRDEA